MADYTPPTENLPIFDKIVFLTGNEFITTSQADKRYLRYPNAQGTENLLATNINGALVVNSSTNLNSSVNIPNNDIFVRNIRIGYGTGNLNRNTVIGVSSGELITTGNDNVFLGSFAGNQNTTANSNVLIGSFTGRYITTGSQNTFVGRDAGIQTTTGIRNTCIGREAGYFNTGNENVFLGSNADATGNINNSVAIGYNVKTTESNTIVIGLTTQKTIIPGGLDIYKPLTISANNNLIMASGTGVISQGVTSSGTNQIKQSNIIINSGTPNGSAQFCLDLYDSAASNRGFLMMPNTGTGTLNPMFRQFDAGILARSLNNSALTMSVYANQRVGFRASSSSSTTASISVEAGNAGFFLDYTSSPLTYDCNLVTPTFDIKNTTNILNRLETSSNGSDSFYLKARAVSGQAIMYLNCYNGITDTEVINLRSNRLTTRQPIQFDYLTSPNSLTQLGFVTVTTMTNIDVLSDADVRNMATYTFVNPGTYLINWNFKTLVLAGFIATFSRFAYGISGASTNFGIGTIPGTSYNDLTKSCPQLDGLPQHFSTSCVFIATASNNVAYFNYQLEYTDTGGGEEIRIGGSYTITRIG